MWADPEVTVFLRARPPEDTWSRILRYIGHWAALGYGYWAIHDRQTDAFLGELGFSDYHRDIDPPFGDDPEIGWTLTKSAEGKGIAFEAATAALAWADAHFTHRTVCMIRPVNERSLRLAARLGFTEYAQTTFHERPTILLERARRFAERNGDESDSGRLRPR